MKWRILTHDSLKCSLNELDNHWCVDDVVEAHQALDEIDAARKSAQNSKVTHG